MFKCSGIYYIKNIVNGMMYIGKAVNIHNRFLGHKRDLKSKNKSQETLYFINAWHHYGEENFEFGILEECEKEKLIQKEIYYIKKLNSKYPNGYNFTHGGEGSLGFFPSDETKKKQSDAKKGKPAYNKGIPMSEEQKQKMVGRKMSDETKQKLINSHKGIPSKKIGTKNKNSTSKYFGVSLKIDGNYKCWCATVSNNGQKKLGSFKNEIDAAKAYDKYVIENKLDRPLNFPEDYNL